MGWEPRANDVLLPNSRQATHSDIAQLINTIWINESFIKDKQISAMLIIAKDRSFYNAVSVRHFSMAQAERVGRPELLTTMK